MNVNFMNLNKQMLDGLVADATAGRCTVILEVTDQGAVLTLKKGTMVTGAQGLSRNTAISRWLDKNDPELDHNITKAFYALP